jgi:hypothetical protein
MTKRSIDRFVEGLCVIRDKVTGSSFYNSSGGDAYFSCDGLDSKEQGLFKSLGWVDVESDGAAFKSWSDADDQ